MAKNLEILENLWANTIKSIVIPKFGDHNPLCPFTMYEKTDFWYPSLDSAPVASGGVTDENSEIHWKHTKLLWSSG